MLMPIKAFPGGSIYSRLCMKLSSFLFAHAGNAAYIIFIMWDSISGLDTWYDFWFNISCGVVVKVRSHQEKFQVIFLWGGEGGRNSFFFSSFPSYKEITIMNRGIPARKYFIQKKFFSKVFLIIHLN